jgi:cold shock CspA family protein
MRKEFGIIRAWNGARGFGFIRPADFDGEGKLKPINDRNQPDVFLHIRAVQRAGVSPDDIADGTPVYFDVRESPRGDGRTEACNIELVRD